MKLCDEDMIGSRVVFPLSYTHDQKLTNFLSVATKVFDSDILPKLWMLYYREFAVITLRYPIHNSYSVMLSSVAWSRLEFPWKKKEHLANWKQTAAKDQIIILNCYALPTRSARLPDLGRNKWLIIGFRGRRRGCIRADRTLIFVLSAG